jgi:hypothetical protein
VYYFYLDLYIYFGFSLARLKWSILLKSVRLPLQFLQMGMLDNFAGLTWVARAMVDMGSPC